MHEMLCQGQEWSSHKPATKLHTLQMGVELDMPATCCLVFLSGTVSISNDTSAMCCSDAVLCSDAGQHHSQSSDARRQ